MILITDGGSTKCDWVLLNHQRDVVFRTKTPGLNPAVLTSEELKRRIIDNRDLRAISEQIEAVDFYGAGCGTSKPKKSVHQVLSALFPNAAIKVYEDTAAAVFAVTTTPGIVCILGTGSNSCYFDGKNIHQPIASLGYSVMDEASGSWFGRALIRDYFYKRMPTSIAEAFAANYNLDADDIKMNLYQKPHPNAYLATFAPFLFQEKGGVKKDAYFYDLIKKEMATFIDCRILSFENATEVPIHFVGSIAQFSKDIIEECFREHNLKLGTILQHPIDGLIEYYKSRS